METTEREAQIKPGEPWRCRMFPLGSVLLPGMALPLHIFEPRYQEMLNESLEDDRCFGVVLITRGHEVGGNDERAMVATQAVIEQHRRFDDGRAAVAARGVRRIEVVEWLPDAPYPQAMVVDRRTDDDHADPASPATAASTPAAGSSDDPDDELADRCSQARRAFAGLISTAREVGRLGAEPAIEWLSDPEAFAWQLAAFAPISTIDRQRILEADRIFDRLSLTTELIDAATADLRLLAEFDGADPGSGSGRP